MRLFLVFFFLHYVHAHGEDIRLPAVAGTFYPHEHLEKTVDSLLKLSKTQNSHYGQLKLLIVPHAGYSFSGKTAAFAYKRIALETFDTIIILGPQHQKSIEGAAVWSKGFWQTPLGHVSIDEDLAHRMVTADDRMTEDLSYHRGEHSIEVQLPFLQRVQPQAKIVPILINNLNFSPILAKILWKILQESPQKILIILSTDMSHHLPDKATRVRDAGTREALIALDPEKLRNILANERGELCGAAAVMTGIYLMQYFAHPKLTILDYRTSKDADDTLSNSVGYMAAMGEDVGALEFYGYMP